MIIRELPWSSGRFFEIDSCNLILQPDLPYTYFILKCHCHQSPELHVADIVTVFGLTAYKTIAPFSSEWLHVIESNQAGKIFYESLKKGLKSYKDCFSEKWL